MWKTLWIKHFPVIFLADFFQVHFLIHVIIGEPTGHKLRIFWVSKLGCLQHWSIGPVLPEAIDPCVGNFMEFRMNETGAFRRVWRGNQTVYSGFNEFGRSVNIQQFRMVITPHELRLMVQFISGVTTIQCGDLFWFNSSFELPIHFRIESLRLFISYKKTALAFGFNTQIRASHHIPESVIERERQALGSVRQGSR